MIAGVTALAYQVRQCQREGCGLRYPVLEGQPFSQRCPRCRGSTRLLLECALEREKSPLSPAPYPLISTDQTDSYPYPPIEALLDNIRSAGNVGSMFRTADGAGLRRLHLCGITATPENPSIAKTSLGAHEHLSWSWHADGVAAALALREDGCRLWALEDTPRSEPLFGVQLERDDRPVVLVVGNEVCGVDPGILELCERILYIPMHGAKRSLNAAVAFGVAVYWLASRNQFWNSICSRR